MTHRTLAEPRPLVELDRDTSGDLTTEWALVTTVVVLPLVLLIPFFLAMIKVYFYRVAEVISFPFP